MCFYCLFYVCKPLKEEREAKRAQLDGRHDYILNTLALCLGLEKDDVEDAILEGVQVLKETLSLGGVKNSKVIFFVKKEPILGIYLNQKDK